MTAGGYWQQAPGGTPPPPPPPLPPQAATSAQPGAPSRRPQIVALAVATVAVVAIFAVAFYAFSTETVVGTPIAGEKLGPPTTTTTTSAAMDADNLPSLLSSPAEVSQLTGVSDLTLGQVYDAPDVPSAGVTYAPAECISATYSGMSQAYDNTGYTSIYQTRVTNSATGARQVLIDQGLVLYPDQATAQRAFDAYRALWQRCGAGFSRTSYGTTTQLTVTPPVDAGNGMLGMTVVDPDDNAQGIDRVIAIKGSLMVDCQTIATPLLSKASVVAKRILDRIPN